MEGVWGESAQLSAELRMSFDHAPKSKNTASTMVVLKSENPHEVVDNMCIS